VTLPDWLKHLVQTPKASSVVVVQAGGQTITVSGEALATLYELSQREGLTLAQVLARAIAVQKAVADANAEGRKVIIEPKGDGPRELVTA
jgi:hypothetical protein